MYRDFVGISQISATDEDYEVGYDNEIIPPKSNKVQPGTYRVVSRTHSLGNNDLFKILSNGVKLLKQNRPLDEDKVKSIESDLLLSYNHFSIHHEGNNLKLDETRMMVTVKTDWKHLVEADELSEEMKEKIKQPDSDLKEARNHIFVADKLPELSGFETSETLVLQMHKWIMSGLLTDKSEGLAGEYRKCPIQISGSSIARPLESKVAPMMKRFFEQTIEKREDEDLMEYISRIHNAFQFIHPFRDGNGRIGRLIMNLALTKHG
jgi:Fic family protein